MLIARVDPWRVGEAAVGLFGSESDVGGLFGGGGGLKPAAGAGFEAGEEGEVTEAVAVSLTGPPGKGSLTAAAGWGSPRFKEACDTDSILKLMGFGGGCGGDFRASEE
jgi:hypothetical protein